jgi:hypothetical protein
MAANITAETREKIYAMLTEGCPRSEIARECGVSERTMYDYAKRACLIRQHVPITARDAATLLRDRASEFERQESSRPMINAIAITDHKPIGITHFGDPHVDDPGCDIRRLQSDLDIVRDTDGLYAGSVGDMQNNWVGRLAHLYSQQTVTAEESWVLVEWLITQYPWMYLIGGNHDAWSGAGDPLLWICRQANEHMHYYGARFELTFPNGRQVRINARHDFKGTSQWNTVHAASKAAMLGFRDHILTCGHTHQSGYAIIASPDRRERIISHCIRVASYKVYDKFAEANNLYGHYIAPNCTTIINPYSTTEEGLVTAFWDLQAAADYLIYLRRKK